MSIYILDYTTFQATSAHDYATLAEAEAWQARMLLSNPTPAVLMTQDAFLLTPVGQSISLEDAKVLKLAELGVEGTGRLPIGVDNIPTARDIILMVQQLSVEGDQAEDVIVAYDNAVIQINALPTVPQVDAYNVVTEPNWP